MGIPLKFLCGTLIQELVFCTDFAAGCTQNAQCLKNAVTADLQHLVVASKYVKDIHCTPVATMLQKVSKSTQCPLLKYSQIFAHDGLYAALHQCKVKIAYKFLSAKATELMHTTHAYVCVHMSPQIHQNFPFIFFYSTDETNIFLENCPYDLCEKMYVIVYPSDYFYVTLHVRKLHRKLTLI